MLSIAFTNRSLGTTLQSSGKSTSQLEELSDTRAVALWITPPTPISNNVLRLRYPYFELMRAFPKTTQPLPRAVLAANQSQLRDLRASH
jgi:hypothetical protein